MKRIYALILSLVMALTLTACGGSEPEQASHKMVENKTIVITGKDFNDAGEVEDYEAEGQYTGQVLAGVPDGEGTFTCQNSQGVTWSYSGEFKNGTFHGKGETVWDTGWRECGTYTDGLFTPNTFELFDSISKVGEPEYSISQENQTFMENHLDLFPAETEDAKVSMDAFIQNDLTYPMMSKTLDGLEGKLYHCISALATQVFQDETFGHTITYVICCDSDYNYYYLCYDGALPDVYAETEIEFVGLPVSGSSYSNVGGGTTNVIVLMACSVTTI